MMHRLSFTVLAILLLTVACTINTTEQPSLITAAVENDVASDNSSPKGDTPPNENAENTESAEKATEEKADQEKGAIVVKQEAKDPNKRVCKRDRQVHTRIPKRICKTQATWDREAAEIRRGVEEMRRQTGRDVAAPAGPGG